MRSRALMIFALLGAFGCANQQLRFSTLRQTSTLPDVQQKQVIENFARLAANTGNLPFYALATGGAVTVLDSGTTGFSVVAVHKAFPSWNIAALTGSRSITENWSLQPENNPDRLKAMRAAYLTVLNPSSVEPKDAQLLSAVIQGDPSYALRQGWVCTGGRWDVPFHAWLVAHCESTYAWVMPENAAEFSRFVLLMLHLETVAPGGGAGGRAASLAPSEFGSPAFSSSPFAPRLFDQPTGVNSGLFFVPRPGGR